ncbi:MAG: hypothetical protein CVU60_02600 [Deltaproteobacteria bacterium HGW-Deltaproteobacteria-18]|nr:MAG: hypothetical protein CVU60_02600 [Deltaproteobacteria bacterium HGW-Deltaproteobacteria-18]
MRGFHILLLMAALLLPGAVFAADTPPRDIGKAEDARLTIAGDRVVGAQLVATFEMGGYEVPEGMYASINVDVEKRPQGGKPDILTGYPHTRLVFDVPGTYELRFRLNQISKSSCGGVDAVPLLETTQTLVILPAESRQ